MMSHIKSTLYHSPLGDIELASYEDKLCLCNWHNKQNKLSITKRLTSRLDKTKILPSSPVINETIKQLDAYFSGKLTEFGLPLQLTGTEFQKQVWQTLQTIPYGHTVSYLELAQRIGNNKAVRAVANANAANAISIIIPCHRIIGSNGKLTGYAGGLAAKQALLDLEQTK
jgi:methylated-DNA-[protein]-cysteine S-methyltransferase